jgi:hypothetical protein
MANECSKKFSVLCINVKNITMYESLKDAIKILKDEGVTVSALLDPNKHSLYVARDSQILRVSPETLCRSVGNLFREEGIGCDI